MSEPDEDRVVVPRDDFHVCVYRVGRRWHFVIIFPWKPYREWDSWLDGEDSEGYHSAKEAEDEGEFHLKAVAAKLLRLQAEKEIANVG